MRSPCVLMIECGEDIEIKGLDGERKALVYDNYSKLIAATETIGKVSFFCFCCDWELRGENPRISLMAGVEEGEEGST